MTDSKKNEYKPDLERNEYKVVIAKQTLMKASNEKGADLLSDKINEIRKEEGRAVIDKVKLDFENEIVYHLGKTITILYAMKYIDPDAEKEIPKMKKSYYKHEEVAKTLQKTLKEDC